MNKNNIAELYSEYTSLDKGYSNDYVITKDISNYKMYLFNDIGGYKNTKYEMVVTLNQFDRFLYVYPSSLKKLSDISEECIKDYISFCRLQLLNKNKTINKKIRYIKNFFEYNKKFRNINDNPAKNILYLEGEEEKEVKDINDGDLVVIMNKMREMYFGIRDICIIKFVANFGLRYNDIFDIKMDQLIKSNKVFIRRGEKEYKIPIDLYIDLSEYIGQRKIIDKYKSQYLFLSRTGNKYNLRCFENAFSKASENKYTPRNIRAYFAYKNAKELEEEDLRIILEQEKVHHYKKGSTFK